MTAPLPTCGCTPGTHDDGWQEVRSERCQQDERDAWGRAMDVARRLVGQVLR